MKKIVVIGGGPAGMIAASTASERGFDVTLIEKNHKLGKKLAITGKGRCNITNDCDIEELIENVPTNGKFLYSAFYTFTNDDVISMFNNLGVKTKTERGKRVFPESDKAFDVVKALEKQVKNKKVNILLNSRVEKIISKNNKIEKVILNNKKEIKCDSVIIATGGLSYPLTGSTGDGYKFAVSQGHTIVDTKPSLIGIEVQEGFVKDLEKLSLRNVEINVFNSKKKKVYNDFGELEFTKFGLDGPIIKSASCRMKDTTKENYTILLDLKPALDEEKLDKRVQKDFQKYTNKKFEKALDDLLPKKLIPIIINLSEISPDTVVHQVSREQRKNLVHLLKNLKFTVKRYRPIDEAIITSGGVKVNEINSSTMESKLVEGLFFAGEVIDIDAYTGGFNLQIAFSTGYLAGFNC
ncbi:MULTISPECIES: NAD(P)/FAD-dependent oxidoreductase [unclassified Clostridioides]|uniref:NAD(P)/FAD-dependent oxidoreductase n=1 Tax=unclassified Clostridioides TaxID=2635829 RepID=UPI001D12139F|nr:NAD(P)/FAD-dependent oxidoreductase [Clostridioides sp. ZZV14-6150]MCC0659943.1 NAD(P)/FAD-dependent oxidoreductase [Clostridioides sp. ZZV14-6154]MCC0720456.1 NAD(P)/FAD-dependent oxidoreductase [Clostridioides sp. ZZV14-6105]MCC0721254.1 NAD(P)/FAD-dependent oxidoreductase [Clostridioides sp. ZZV14-6104]MCC0728094.1 NAD(P)/FAD-dependent oxidoreductase [Clostridioides sp. ZZV14-6045]MCC0731530.1 NAD(P)/FAD-dependent oxidoreductase [Clostridioides sp. ZZV14-6048]MCC0733037.1 NAD(P)/FAD-dep